jgi:hypothetical protein
MSDNLSPANTPPAEDNTQNTVTNRSGGVNLDTQRDVNIGGDVVGRDKVTYMVITRDKNLSIPLEKVRVNCALKTGSSAGFVL